MLAVLQKQSWIMTWYLHYNYLRWVATDERHSCLIYFMETLWRTASCHSTRSWLQAQIQMVWCPIHGWGGWGYVTKYLASSFQRHMGLHKHILLCVCRLQTHCLTQSLRLSCNELEWAQMRGRNLNYWDTPPVQTYTFTSGDFLTGFSGVWLDSRNIFIPITGKHST